MLTYFAESDDIKMDVQVGPQEEVEAEVEGEDFCERCGNPVDASKKNPETVPVGCCIDQQTGVKEFYVDIKDVAKLAEMNDITISEALDAIIGVNEGSGMYPDNIIVVMSEGAEAYQSILERINANFVTFNEADDMSIDVQVGPNEDEIDVSENPQEANPLDAVKRNYGNVVIAKDGDNFFMDVEDVQKCAELNCESVIDTVNNIIDYHEDYEMTPNNTMFICSEGTNAEAYDELMEAGAILLFESAEGDNETAHRKKIIKDLGSCLRNFLIDNGNVSVNVSTAFIGGENAKFIKGKGNTVLLGINATEDSLNKAILCIKKNSRKLASMVQDRTGCKMTSVRAQEGRVGVINVAMSLSC